MIRVIIFMALSLRKTNGSTVLILLLPKEEKLTVCQPTTNNPELKLTSANIATDSACGTFFMIHFTFNSKVLSLLRTTT
jgi:hypothetical protein